VRTASLFRFVALAAVVLAALVATGAGLEGPVRPAHAQPQQPRGWLGVVMSKGSPEGVPVREVVRGSPAFAAGVAGGDRIVAVDGARVSAPGEVIARVGARGPGQAVRLSLVRAGRTLELGVTLAPYPSGEQMLRLRHVGLAARELAGLRSIAGAPVPTLAAARGKVVVLDFWASWCVACRYTVPYLNGWQTSYGRRGVAVIGVAAETPHEAAAGVRDLGVRYACAADPDQIATEAWGVQEMPSVLLIDRRGVVRDAMTGYDPRRIREMTALIERLLDEAP
jgi:thiol-disulfide isomerase/thioredoxin